MLWPKFRGPGTAKEGAKHFERALSSVKKIKEVRDVFQNPNVCRSLILFAVSRLCNRYGFEGSRGYVQLHAGNGFFEISHLQVGRDRGCISSQSDYGSGNQAVG